MISRHSRRIFVVGLVFLAIPTSLAGADGPEIHTPIGSPPPMCPYAGPGLKFNVSGRVLFSSGDNGDSDNVKVTFQRYDPVTKKVFGVVITDSDTVNNA